MNTWMEYAVEAAIAAVIAYFTSQKTTAVNIAELQTSIRGLRESVDDAKQSLGDKIDDVRDEVRTYYERKK